MTIKETLEAIRLRKEIRVLVKTRFHNSTIPLGGGNQELIIKKFGNLEVNETSVSEHRNICFYVPFTREYLV